eukprot:CAMPEP_0119126222 /NCGR_PEP_ID=MMETSP1310-20130426/5228_1 /TAXON_ID=464262 /ORGANISM="Genus nov. species nov., Strain RCC2339" /LENGTH=699 /DNA_ID=CAMNT_0007116371 /DNA_START=73 /DNA_END=2173 /DNA_ORIENTATION=+
MSSNDLPLIGALLEYERLSKGEERINVSNLADRHGVGYYRLRRAIKRFKKSERTEGIGAVGRTPYLTEQELDLAVAELQAMEERNAMPSGGRDLATFFSGFSSSLKDQGKTMCTKTARDLLHKLKDEGRVARRWSINVDATHMRSLGDSAKWDWQKGLQEIIDRHPDIKDDPNSWWNADECEVSWRAQNRKKSYVVSVSKRRDASNDNFRQPAARTHAEIPLGHVTLVAGGNANGDRLPPAYVMKAQPPAELREPYITRDNHKQYPFHMTKDHMNKVFVTQTDNGYMTMERWKEYLLDVAAPAIRKVVPEGPVVLSFDGALVHSIDDLEALRTLVLEKEIILYCFPHITTLIRRPMDNGVIAAYKNLFNKILQAAGVAATNNLFYLNDQCELKRSSERMKSATVLERTQGVFENSNMALSVRSLIWISETAMFRVEKKIFRRSFEDTGGAILLRGAPTMLTSTRNAGLYPFSPEKFGERYSWVGGDTGGPDRKAAAAREKDAEQSGRSQRLLAQQELDYIRTILDSRDTLAINKMEQIASFILNKAETGQVSLRIHKLRLEREAEISAALRVERDYDDPAAPEVMVACKEIAEDYAKEKEEELRQRRLRKEEQRAQDETSIPATTTNARGLPSAVPAVDLSMTQHQPESSTNKRPLPPFDEGPARQNDEGRHYQDHHRIPQLSKHRQGSLSERENGRHA